MRTLAALAAVTLVAACSSNDPAGISPPGGVPRHAVVIAHFHGDHPGRLESFAGAQVRTGAGNWPTHTGSVPCTLPLGFEPELAGFGDGPFGEFPASQKLLDRDDVRLVPLPWHTRGHVGALVEDAGRYWLIAGDATFNRLETEHTHVCGVSEDVESARETQRLILQQLHKHDTVLLPAHDPAVFALLAAQP